MSDTSSATGHSRSTAGGSSLGGASIVSSNSAAAALTALQASRDDGASDELAGSGGGLLDVVRPSPQLASCRRRAGLCAWRCCASPPSSFRYASLLYGGPVPTVRPVAFDTNAPPAAFANVQFGDLFFRTTACQRSDGSCFPEGHKWYQITHNGLDAMMHRMLDSLEAFAALPDSLAYANHTLYSFALSVGGRDLYEGMRRAVGLFEAHTMSEFGSVTVLHEAMLGATLGLFVAYFFLLYRPYLKRLRAEARCVAGLLSQLPPEVQADEALKAQLVPAALAAPSGGLSVAPATR